MSSARASAQHFAGTGYLETFGHRFPGFNAFGASHTSSLSLEERKTSSHAHDEVDFNYVRASLRPTGSTDL
jgi:hypothetical protein